MMNFLPNVIKITMTLTVGINGSTDSFWRESDNEYVGLVPIPGVCGANVSQKGRVINITGENRILKVSYSYTVSLHPDSTDCPMTREENGMIIITCPKVSQITRQLSALAICTEGVPAVGGATRIGESK